MAPRVLVTCWHCVAGVPPKDHFYSVSRLNPVRMMMGTPLRKSDVVLSGETLRRPGFSLAQVWVSSCQIGLSRWVRTPGHLVTLSLMWN